ncbi:MFS transporter [Candidatus Lokiarchaeum ossiferum]|uniref:MFS transporter n=1 Tax=Candidatus Lokiarchaeum ossiferum TaxID=2951803 RepID=UPI00352D4716
MEAIKEPKQRKFSRFLLLQALVIGFIKMGESVFFFFEQNYLNLYLVQVLNKEAIFVSIMVSVSAVMGLILQFLFGIISDNTRTKYGRRRPFFIFGGILAGISMITYAFSGSYILCLILDGIIIAIGTNSYLAAERSLIPDVFEPEYRGRANGIIYILGNIGLVIALGLFLVSEDLFGYDIEVGSQTVTYISQAGFIALLSIGGGFIILGGIVGFLFVKEANVSSFPPKKKISEELKETFRISELKKHKEFGKIIIAIVVFRTGISVIMPFLFNYILGLPMDVVQLLIAIMVLSFPLVFVFTYLMGKYSDKFGRKRMIPFAILFVAIGTAVTPLIGLGDNFKYWLVLLCFPFVMISILGFDGSMDTWSQDLLPENKRGQFNGILNITFTVSQIIGAFISGLVVDTQDPTTWGLIFPIGAIFFVLSIPLFMKVKDTLKNEDKI